MDVGDIKFSYKALIDHRLIINESRLAPNKHPVAANELLAIFIQVINESLPQIDGFIGCALSAAIFSFLSLIICILFSLQFQPFLLIFVFSNLGLYFLEIIKFSLFNDFLTLLMNMLMLQGSQTSVL